MSSQSLTAVSLIMGIMIMLIAWDDIELLRMSAIVFLLTAIVFEAFSVYIANKFVSTRKSE